MAARDHKQTTLFPGPRQEVECWRMYTYDVWGNARDGFEVNNVFRTNHVVEIPETASLREILNILKEAGLVRRDVRPSQIRIDDGTDDLLDVEWASNGEPQFRLEREDCRERQSGYWNASRRRGR